MILNRR